MPSGVGFLSAYGIGVTGLYSTIHSNAVANDAAGDTYIAGSYRGTASFNPSSPASTITTNSTQDTFVAKYGPTGSFLWVKTFAGQATTYTGGITTTATSQGSAIAVDGSGNVFIAGGYDGTVNLSSVKQITSPLATTQVYLAKLDPSGNLLWVDTVAGTLYDDDEAYALALDGSGGAIIAGSFAGSATFGSTTLTALGSSEAFGARINGSGTFLWAVASQGSAGSNAQINGVAVDSSGNVALAGFFSGKVDFNPSSSTASLTSAGSDDALLWKLTTNGSFVWAEDYGAADYDVATAIAVDPAGNLYATGAFSDTVSFGTTSLVAGPIFDTFVLKLTPSGTVVWADGLVGPGGWSKGQGIAVDAWGDVHVAGAFLGTVDFDPGPGTDNLTSVANTDLFVAGFSSTGSLIYGLQAGETNANSALGLAVNASGLVAITGMYSSSIAFGSITLPVIGLGSFYYATLQAPTSPPALLAPVLEASSDTGTSHSDDITADTTPVLDVNSALATSTVNLLRNGVIVATRLGPGPIMDPGPITNGTSTYTATQVSPSGFVSPVSPGLVVTFMTTPPLALPAPTLDPVDDSGVVGDGITNVRQPRLVIAAQSNTTIQILNATGVVIGSGLATSTGTFLLAPSQPLADGTYALQVRAIDVAGNVGLAGPAYLLTILATPPASLPAPTLYPSDDSGVVGDNITNVRQPRLVIAARANTTIQILNATGVVIGSGLATSTGTLLLAPSQPLADGTYALQVRAIDVAGNVGATGPALTLTILATPPLAPSAPAVLAADDSGVVGDGITNVSQPRLTGTAPANTTVQILGPTGVVYATTPCGAAGSYLVKLTNALADGTYLLHAVAIDVAGNVSPAGPSFSLRILTATPLAPSAPALLVADDSETLGDGITNVSQPRLTGTAPANTTVQILGPTGVVYATTPCGAAGSYLVKLTNALADGTYLLHAVAIDVAGNVSPAGPSFSLRILTATPLAPSAPSLLPADDSGTLGDGITNVRQPRLTASAPAGLTVQLLNGSNVAIGSATATISGSVTISPALPLVDGTYVLHLVAVDVAGNVSLSNGSISLTILGTPPPKPVAPTLLAADDTGVLNDGMTSVRRPRIIGSAVPGGRIDWVTANGSVLTSTTASPLTGSYQLQPTTALPNGVYSVTIRETDVAGNVSQLSASFNLTIRVASGDAFGDGVADLGVVRQSDSTFFIQRPTTGALFALQFGAPGDVPVKGDFFGNGHQDIAVFVQATATFYVLDPVTNAFMSQQFGGPGDIPVPADYDGDGKTDFAVFRPSNDTFYIKMSATNTGVVQQFGGAGDIPVPADYVGNGHADFAIYRPSMGTFYMSDPVSGNSKIVTVGTPNGIPIPADYEGLGHADFAVYQPSTLSFVIQLTATNTVLTRSFGGPGDVPVSGDFTGDGRTDLAVFRPSTPTFYIENIATGATQADQWGPANTVLSVISPITTWFTFASSGNGRLNAMAVTLTEGASTPVVASPSESNQASASPLVKVDLPVVIVPAVGVLTSARRVATGELLVGSLDLDGGRS